VTKLNRIKLAHSAGNERIGCRRLVQTDAKDLRVEDGVNSFGRHHKCKGVGCNQCIGRINGREDQVTVLRLS